MFKTCPKCGYTRLPQDDDMVPKDECPKCGMIYAKAEASLKKEEKRKIKETPPTNTETQQTKVHPTWQVLLITIIFVLGIIGLVYEFLIPHKEPIVYDSTYKKSENQYGVRFYYFTGENTPAIDPINNFSDLKDMQLNKILSSITDFPKEKLNRPFKVSGKESYTSYLKNGRSISIYIRKCNEKEEPYFCIKKIIYSPNDKEKAQIKASKYPEDYIFVSEKEYGDKWPYKFKFGLLACKRWRDVVIIANGNVYAVNGKAMGSKLYENAWNERKTIYDTGRMPPPHDLIKKGLSLCEKNN